MKLITSKIASLYPAIPFLLAISIATGVAADDGETKKTDGDSASRSMFLPGEFIRLVGLVLALSIPLGVIGFFAHKLVTGMEDKEKKRELKKQQKQQKNKKATQPASSSAAGKDAASSSKAKEKKK